MKTSMPETLRGAFGGFQGGRMSSSYRIDPERGFVEITHRGSVGANELFAVAVPALEAAGGCGITHFLSDTTDLDGAPPLKAMLDLCASLHERIDITRFRHAVLLPANEGLGGLIRFWETACQNRGIQARCFADRDHAVAWLKSEEPAEASPGFRDLEVAC
jgi:hypothetical protein